MDARKMLIDTDPALGYALRDVDDGLALILAVRHGFDVRAVTAVHGNVGADKGVRSARRLLGLLGRTEIPVYRGASSAKRLGEISPASEAIVREIEAAGGELRVAALGPLTNLATAELAAPGILKKARQIVVMAGALRRPGHIPPAMQAEFNTWKDPRAADVVYGSGANIALIPLDVTMRVFFGPKQMKALRQSKSRLAQTLWRDLQSWFWLNNAVFAGRGFNPHDPIAIAWLIAPELFRMERVKIRTILKGLSKGRLKETAAGSEVAAAFHVDPKGFLDLLMPALIGGEKDKGEILQPRMNAD